MIIPFIHGFDGGHKFIFENPPLDVPHARGNGVERRGAEESVRVRAAAIGEISGNTGTDLLAESDERQKHSFEEFIRRVGEGAKDEKGKKEFADWAAKQTDVELLRRAGIDVKDNNKDVLAKHVKLASEYLNKLEDKDGHVVFEVNFKGNELAEWKIGAGNLLPSVVKAVKIYDASGNSLTQSAIRGVRGGRVGYFDSGSGPYVPIHSGYKIEILEVQAVTVEEVSTRIKEESDLFEKDEKKLAIKDNLEKFFKDKNLDVKVDDNYFIGGIDDLLGKLGEADSGWWQKYLENKFTYNDFESLFNKTFTEQDLTFIGNLCRLRDLQKSGQQGEKIPDDVFMSDFVRLQDDLRFADFKNGKLNDDQLYEFAKKGFEFGGSYSDVVADSVEVSSKEPFTLVDGKFWLRQGAAKALSSAREYAKTLEPPVELKLNSAHRGCAHQEGIYAKALKKYGSAEAARKWVALPGSSPHHTGGAMDIYAVVNGKGGVKHPNQKYLKMILPRFGFVNYSPEPWHWETHTRRWARLTGSSGPIYTTRAETINASNASKLA